VVKIKRLVPAKFCEERIHDARSVRAFRGLTGRRSAMARRARYSGFALQNFGQGADGDALGRLHIRHAAHGDALGPLQPA
jgi:hypothetical protein